MAERQHRFSYRTGIEDDGNQFRRREHARAVFFQPFARAIVGIHFANSMAAILHAPTPA